MKPIFCFLIVLFIIPRCVAQDSVRLVEGSRILPKHTVKFSPMHLLSFYPTVQVAYEMKISPIWTLQLDGGIIVDPGYHERFRDMRGYKIKAEPRRYFSFNESRRLSFYTGFELYRNNVTFGRTADQVECFDPECVNRYRRTYSFRMTYREHGLAFKPGLIKYLGSFLLDVNTGFAIRVIEYNAPAYIQDSDKAVNWYDVPREKDRTAFAPVFNFRIGYSLP